MLHITRRVGEAIVINNSIEIRILEINGNNVKIGCTSPDNTSILREELYEKIMRMNQQSVIDIPAEFLQEKSE